MIDHKLVNVKLLSLTCGELISRRPLSLSFLSQVQAHHVMEIDMDADGT